MNFIKYMHFRKAIVCIGIAMAASFIIFSSSAESAMSPAAQERLDKMYEEGQQQIRDRQAQQAEQHKEFTKSHNEMKYLAFGAWLIEGGVVLFIARQLYLIAHRKK